MDQNYSSQINVKICSYCKEATMYHCHTCQQDLCRHCKESHTINLDTKQHDVTVYRERMKYTPKREVCASHPRQVYEMYCESCNTPFCVSCKEHKNHETLNLRTAYEDKRKKHYEKIGKLKDDTLYSLQILRLGLKSDIRDDAKTIREEIEHLQSAIGKMFQKMNYLMDDAIITVKDDATFKYQCLLHEQSLKISKRNTMLNRYEEKLERTANRPVQFLKFVKKVSLCKFQNTPSLPQSYLFSLSQDIKTEDIVKLLREIRIEDRGKRQVKKERLLKRMTSPVLQKTITMTDLECCHHISNVECDSVWVGDTIRVALVDIPSSSILHSLVGVPHSHGTGSHTLDNQRNLNIINNSSSIIKVSFDMQTRTNVFQRKDPAWEMMCVHFSNSTLDLLIGMYNRDLKIGKILRYSTSGKLIKTIQYDQAGKPMYRIPRYLTENNNGDIVVSVWRYNEPGCVVVTDAQGRRRFSYRGSPQELNLVPRGICTDALSHILVCDRKTETVHLIDKDGQFLCFLLTKELPGIKEPYCLSYDFRNHILLVGSRLDNKISVFRYINRYALDSTSE